MPLPFTSIFRALGRALLLPLLLLLAGGSASAQVTNGGFEASAPGVNPITGWTKVRWQNLNGLIIPPSGPFTGASIQRSNVGTAGTDLTDVVTAGDDVNTIAPYLLSRVRFNNQAVVVNYMGSGYNANSLYQTITLDSVNFPAEADGKHHIRFAYAPVLQSGGHVPKDQPYFYVGVTDTTNGSTLYDSVNYSAQAGITWHTTGTVFWTDWQVVDLALDPTYLNHSISLEFTAAGCDQSGHWGHLYVDGVAPTIQDLWITGSGPATVTAGNNITYTYTIRNDSSATTYNNVTLSLAVPTDNQAVPVATTFVSSTLPGGGLSDNLGTLAPGATATYSMTVNVPVSAAGKIIHGDYYVSATGYSALAGPAISTVISGPPTDLGTTVTASAGAYHQISYLVTVTNNGPAVATAAQASFTLPPFSTFVSASGPVGVLVTGAGPVLAQFGDMASGTSKTFTVVVSMPAGTPAGTLVTGTATASGAFTNTNAAGGVGSGSFTWPDPLAITANPTGGSYLNSTYGGPTVTLTVASSGGWGTPTYQWYRGPAGDTSNPVGTNSASYTVPTNVDGTFSYWARVSDAGTSVDSQAASVTVFSTHDITTATIGNGTITPGGVVAVTHGTNQTFNIAAGFCYYIRDVVVDGVSQGPFPPMTVYSYDYTFTNVTTTHTLTATFWINHYALTYLAGPNGSIVGPNPQSVDCGFDGAPVTALGTPGSTYTFWTWSDGSQINPRTDTNVLADLSVTATFATQEEEPNDNYAQATRVSGPGLCVGRVNPANALPRDSADYYRIVLPNGSTLTATLVPPANGLRYYFYIYNQMGKVMAQSATIRGVANTAVVKNTSGATLYYYVAVRTTSGSSATYYNLNLNW
jgi:uncharacterized repeat protein (TIGR01451 family)